MCHDPNYYSDPFSFRPERFLTENGREPDPDPYAVVFGYGRRICPGRYMADSSLFISFAMIIATIDITEPITQDGRKIEPNCTSMYLPGVIR